MNKLLIKSLMLSGAVLLSACGHENPVMKNPDFDILTGYIKDSRFMGSHESKVCPSYLANPSEQLDDKALCESWVYLLYKKERDDFKYAADEMGVPYIEPTQEDFRDPALWEAVLKQLSSKP